MTTQHTPLPWVLENKTNSIGIRSVDEDQSFGMIIQFVDVYGDNKEEDSSFILKACNNHYELLKIAEAYKNLLRTSAQTEEDIATFNHINSILLQAKGEV